MNPDVCFICPNCKQQFLFHFTLDFRSKFRKWHNTQQLATTETTEQHGNFTLFHFQNDQMWPVNMTGKTKAWPVNSQISSDIVRWPAVISSPEVGDLLSVSVLWFLLMPTYMHSGSQKRNVYNQKYYYWKTTPVFTYHSNILICSNS